VLRGGKKSPNGKNERLFERTVVARRGKDYATSPRGRSAFDSIREQKGNSEGEAHSFQRAKNGGTKKCRNLGKAFLPARGNVFSYRGKREKELLEKKKKKVRL